MRTILWPFVLVGLFLALLPAMALADWQGEIRSLLDARQYQKALVLLEKNPSTTAEFLRLHAEACFETGRLTDAQNDLDAALKQNDNDADAHALLALVFAKQKLFGSANTHAKKALDLQRKPRTLYTHAIASLGFSEVDKSAAEIDEALAAEPKNPDYLLAKGAILRLRGKTDEAMVFIEKAQAADKRPYKVHLEKTVIALGKGDPVKAKEEIQKAVEVAPELYPGYLGRGLVNLEYGDKEAALTDFTKALQLAPQVPELAFSKANLLIELGRGAEAEQVMLAAKPYCAEIPDWYVMVALLQGTLNKKDAALATLNELIAKYPSHPNGYDLRGQYYVSTQQFDLAMADFDRAIQLNPKGVESRLNKVLLLDAMKRPQEEMLKLLNQVLAENPDHPMVLQMRMKLYEAMGKKAEALEDLKRLQELRKKQ